jgi:EAL domain-containing protein (putative c-di-GMP-specific phosphodiesterase class I)
VSVNVTAADLLDPDFLPALRAGLAEHGVAPAGLVLEITERGVLDDAPVAASTLAALARLGVGLWLDDVGTGYSSLAHLVRVPVTEVKIDRSLIANLAPTPSRRPSCGPSSTSDTGCACRSGR